MTRGFPPLMLLAMRVRKVPLLMRFSLALPKLRSAALPSPKE